MFDCNDNNFLLILGIGIIFLILLKIYYSKQKNKLSCKKNKVHFKEYLDISDNMLSVPSSQPIPIKSVLPSQLPSQINNIQQQQQVPNINTSAYMTSTTTSQIPTSIQQQTQNIPNKQPSITVTPPIIDDDIFQPKFIDWNYGDATNNDYTLNVNDISTNKIQKLELNDLLPKVDDNSKKWFENPDVEVKVEDANLLSDAIQKVGVDTIGQTKKNPSYDLRGTVPCPKFQISPWNNSTTEPDYNLKSLY